MSPERGDRRQKKTERRGLTTAVHRRLGKWFFSMLRRAMLQRGRESSSKKRYPSPLIHVPFDSPPTSGVAATSRWAVTWLRRQTQRPTGSLQTWLSIETFHPRSTLPSSLLGPGEIILSKIYVDLLDFLNPLPYTGDERADRWLGVDCCRPAGSLHPTFGAPVTFPFPDLSRHSHGHQH